MIEAVIFDMDGTLIDSIPAYLTAYERVLGRRMGIHPDESVIKRQFGKTSRDILLGVFEELNIDPEETDIDAILAEIRGEFVEVVKDIIILPGAVEVLKRLKGKYKLGLATSSKIHYAGKILKNFGLFDYFDAIVTADDVVRAKPDPEIFAIAARKLSSPPERCVAVEDAVHGIRSARGAGMRVIAVTTGSSTREEIEAERPDAIIGSLDELDARILM